MGLDKFDTGDIAQQFIGALSGAFASFSFYLAFISKARPDLVSPAQAIAVVMFIVLSVLLVYDYSDNIDKNTVVDRVMFSTLTGVFVGFMIVQILVIFGAIGPMTRDLYIVHTCVLSIGGIIGATLTDLSLK